MCPIELASIINIYLYISSMTLLFLSFQMEISFVTFVVVLIFQFLNIEGNGRFICVYLLY